MERISALVTRGDGRLARFLGLVLWAEVTYAVGVRAVLGEPPAPLVTVMFAMLVAGGLAVQEHRSRGTLASGPRGG